MFVRHVQGCSTAKNNWLTGMAISAELFTVMPSRPCSFCLSLQGGQVFADFDIDAGGLVSLLRISFDSYGCCHLSRASKMAAEDSRLIRSAVALKKNKKSDVQHVLRRYFQSNSVEIWRDALEEYGFI